MSGDCVLVLGATGKTGEVIVKELLQLPDFVVIAAVHPSSAEKPVVLRFQNRGAEIRVVDIEKSTPEQLSDTLKGVDVVLCAIEWTQIKLQYPLIDAAKKAGVKRFIWAPTCARGVRRLHDEKLAVHDYIKKSGIGYTFIDVALWFMLPVLNTSKAMWPIQVEFSKQMHGTGDIKCAFIDRRDVGTFVARVLRDECTLNRCVFCWAVEATQNEVFALAERISGQKIDIVRVSKEDLAEKLKKSEGMERAFLEYAHSWWIRGDNAVENAKKEYRFVLDGKELYPDLELGSFETYAKEFYLE
ncbi:NAD-binding protein [Phellopilus nigrolimitatus]|nr:NAD-binding protein [Phellopilus nigrolimitatus]